MSGRLVGSWKLRGESLFLTRPDIVFTESQRSYVRDSRHTELVTQQFSNLSVNTLGITCIRKLLMQ